MQIPEKPGPILVALTAKDRKATSSAAKRSDQTVEEWIASLVNMALKS
jgi:hypothetical protein